ncbi:MAG: ribosome silencing factor [Methylococcaceae bacterium]|nr:MAG: ribosome silencing factor [Methylococcaceae bacterium]
MQQHRKQPAAFLKPVLPADELLTLVLSILDDGKAVNVTVLDVRKKTGITDYMVVAGGTSDRHVRSLAEKVAEKVKEHGILPLGTEGKDAAEWVLVDLGDVIVHAMKPDTRELYQLEKLWGTDYGNADPN